MYKIYVYYIYIKQYIIYYVLFLMSHSLTKVVCTEVWIQMRHFTEHINKSQVGLDILCLWMNEGWTTVPKYFTELIDLRASEAKTSLFNAVAICGI